MRGQRSMARCEPQAGRCPSVGLLPVTKVSAGPPPPESLPCFLHVLQEPRVSTGP